jgi:hypothetical protein
VLERFATVSVELSVHTDNSHPESLQHEHEQSGRDFKSLCKIPVNISDTLSRLTDKEKVSLVKANSGLKSLSKENKLS